MPLTQDQLAFVKELSKRPNLGTTTHFDDELTDQGKEWFCRRLAQNADPQGGTPSSTALQQAVDRDVVRAAALIEEWSSMEGLLVPAETAPEEALKDRTKKRISALHQIVACAIAIHQPLAEHTVAAEG